MLAIALVVFRETLEAALIISIVLAASVGVPGRGRWVAGGTATRLAANDPPACSGATSPGVLNSWPKWAPEVQSYRGRQYYWISFSSTRAGANPQLYVSGLVVENGTLRTYRSLYLWNQPAGESNHTAAWDAFRFMPPG